MAPTRTRAAPRRPLVWLTLFFVVVFGTLIVLGIDAYQYRRACEDAGGTCIEARRMSLRCVCVNLERIEP